MKIAAPISETGIATSGTSAVRTEPMKRNTTRPTIRIVSASVLVISVSASSMNTVRVVGQLHVDVLAAASGGSASISACSRCATSISLTPISGQTPRYTPRLVAVLGDEVGLLGAQLDLGHVAQADDGARSGRRR